MLRNCLIGKRGGPAPKKEKGANVIAFMFLFNYHIRQLSTLIMFSDKTENDSSLPSILLQKNTI